MADTEKDKNSQFWDPRIANMASAVDHCMKLGAVIIKPERQAAGFRVPGNELPGPESND